MGKGRESLLAGRNRSPLTESEIRRAANTFLGLDSSVPVHYDPDSPTIFHVTVDETGIDQGEIIIGPDIYPGGSIVDPNSALSLQAAAVHELTHFYRWRDKAELPDGRLTHLDEALTSLEAICRYERHLNPTDVHQLVTDAIQRLHLHIKELGLINSDN